VQDDSLGDAVAAYEKTLIQDALKTARGNASRAAKLLHSTERIISYKIRKLGIVRNRFRG
jgi:Nif-specific regulatory protein